jgi:Tfp pilus assembly protein PilF/peroxiredoxin
VSNSPDAESEHPENLPASFGGLTAMLREGRSFSGRERNSVFLNTLGDTAAAGRFANVSGVSGIDFPDDARAVAQVDWDGDGDLDLWISNRNAPRLRFLRNNYAASKDTHFVSFRLTGNGTSSNRDAIGARIEVVLEDRKLVRTLRAGEGFLSQSSKWLHIGLGKVSQIEKVIVRWPDGNDQHAEEFKGLEPDRRYVLAQGSGEAQPLGGREEELKIDPSPNIEPLPAEGTARLHLVVRLPAPDLKYLSLDGRPMQQNAGSGNPVLINFWSRTCSPCLAELAEFGNRSAEIRASGIEMLALSTDHLGKPEFDANAAQEILSRLKYPFPSGRANPELIGGLQERLAYLTPMLRPFPLPTSFLIDGAGRLAVVYKGAVEVDDLLVDARRITGDRPLSQKFADAAALPGTMIDHPAIERTLREITAKTMLNVADGLRQAGRLSEAAAQFEEALKLTADSAFAHNDFAMVLRRLGKLEEARNHYETALQIAPDLSEAHNNYGVLLFQLGDRAKAREQYEQALRLDPNYADAEMNLGVLFERQGDVAGAKRHYQNALGVNPKLVAAEINLGLLAEKQGILAEARAHYENALAIAPRHIDALNNLGVVCAKLKDIDHAVAYLEKAVETDPAFTDARNNLGIVLESRGQFAQAMEQYQEALRVDPGDAAAKRNLANLRRLINQ